MSAIPHHQICKIAHSKLILRDDNRTVERNKENTKLRAANIKEIGILQNIVVTKAEQEGHFYLEAGYGRYASVEILIAEKATTADDFFYPAMIAEKSNLSAIIKLAENNNRDSLHPVDEFLTYQKAIKDGHKVKEIANTMGVSIKHVNQRLTLAKLSPVIIDALRVNKITVAVAEAFTLCDTERQEMIFAGLNSWECERPDIVKKRIIDDKMNAADSLVHFVGLNTYKKAGGQVTQSLFDSTAIIENAELLRSLAREKLEAEAKQYGIDGWKWVELYLGEAVDCPIFSKTGALQAINNTTPSEIAQAIITTQTELNALNDIAEPSADHYNRMSELESKLYELEEAAELYDIHSPENMAFSGCIVGVSPTGKIQILKGRYFDADMPRETDTNQAIPANAGDEKEYTEALTSDLSRTRTALLQAAIAQSYDHAIDLGIFSIADNFLRVQHRGYCSKGSAISLTADTLENADNRALAVLEKVRLSLNLGWTNIGKNDDRYHAFTALSRTEKDAIFAYCVARGVQPHLASHLTPEPVKIITEAINPFYRQHWAPERDSYFKRLSIAQLLEIGQEIFGDAWSEGNKGTTKKDLVNEIADAFSGKNKTLTDEQKRCIAHWTPKGF